MNARVGRGTGNITTGGLYIEDGVGGKRRRHSVFGRMSGRDGRTTGL